MALELSEIYKPRTDNLNYTQYNGATSTTQCYRCSNFGHYSRDCPNERNPTKSTNSNKQYPNRNKQRNQNQQQTNTSPPDPTNQQPKINQTLGLRAIEYSNSITGWCKLDDKYVRFMADTGASRTVVDSKLLDSTQTDKLKTSTYNVLLADGSPANVKGLLDCVISLNNKPIGIEILVIENLPEGCLLGFDFLKKHPSTRDLVTKLNQTISGNNDTKENNIKLDSVQMNLTSTK